MITVEKYPALKRTNTFSGTQTSSKWSLPLEFDSVKYASGFHGEGQEALSMQAEQPVIGTNYVSEGWSVWKYPAEGVTGFDDDNQPIMGPHPMAGKPHKVAGSKPGENFVLMFRSAEVQAQVNHIYGVLSIEQMTAEARGETLSVEGADGSMLTAQQLGKEGEAERQADELNGRSSAVHASVPSSQRIGKTPQRVSR